MNTIQDKANTAANFLKGIANPHRLLILCLLAEGEKNVTSLVETTGIPQTSISQHLAKLKQEKIVTFRRDHRVLYYSICNEAVTKIMDVLYQTFCKE
ncbi:ArsR/SmtB family transcription factor [Entomomonas asaccharolytica]|uniref:Winged helix-turn-helix transcriptional regulator n=1 Tax=Entomomonas asaccharolytica TaxID=2785331 RepID=A0A974NGK7_9GAMM|nr:metalloregulator ArsR/SmtB family transcription factor [Entomomonas asaccharolytica]QQP86400.1 winged helix-turn-helix transcriptional regulator [Entomomonas asaccharolytica]